MRFSQSGQRLKTDDGQRRITLFEAPGAGKGDADLKVGSKVRLHLIDESGRPSIGKFIWRIAEIIPANHDRPAVYRLECGNGSVSVSRGHFEVVEGSGE